MNKIFKISAMFLAGALALSPDGTKMALHVMKDIMSRKLIYSLSEYKDVIDLALEMNPEIHVSDVDF